MRLVVGDPLVRPDVVTEVRAVAAAGVPFDVVPGHARRHRGADLRRRRPRPAHTSVDLTAGEAVDYAALAVAPGPLVLQAIAAELAGASASLIENGWKPGTPALVTAGGTGSRQRTVETTLDKLAADGAETSRARSSSPSATPSPTAPRCPGGSRAPSTAGACSCPAPRTRPAR